MNVMSWRYARAATLVGTGLLSAILVYGIKTELDDLYKIRRFMRNPQPSLHAVLELYKREYERKSA